MRVLPIIGFIFFILGGSHHVFSQSLPLGYDTLSHSHELKLDGSVDFYGSAVQMALTSKFIKGGFITEDIKNSSFERHKGINRFGGVFGGDIEYRNYTSRMFKNKDWGFVVKGGYHLFAGMLYSKDLFGLVFYGNEPFRGETMDMSGLDISYMAFQKVGFGFIAPKSKSSITFNVYNVSDRISGDFRTFELSQDELGDEVTLTLDGEFQLKNNAKFNQGIGVGFDADFKLPIAWMNDRTAFIQFEARNIGFAYMYEKQKVYSIDTTLVLSGFSFDDIMGEENLFSDSLDVLDTLGVRSTEKNVTSLLPGYIQIGKMVDDHCTNQLQSFFGIRLYPTLIYSPYVFAGLDYAPIKALRLGLSASYGGFGGFRAGFYIHSKFSNYSIGLGSENVIGFFSKKASGQSLQMRLKWVI